MKICKNPECGIKYTPSYKYQKYHARECVEHKNIRKLNELPFLCYTAVPTKPITKGEGEREWLQELTAIRKDMQNHNQPLWNDFLDDGYHYRRQWNSFVNILARMEKDRILDLMILE